MHKVQFAGLAALPQGEAKLRHAYRPRLKRGAQTVDLVLLILASLGERNSKKSSSVRTSYFPIIRRPVF